jgi:hypothetical protein
MPVIMVESRQDGRFRVYRLLDVALIETPQGIQQLAPEHPSAPPVVGQRRERLNHREVTLRAPVVALDAPHGGEQFRRHTVTLADVPEQLAVLGEHELSFLDAALRHDAREVAAEIERELRLRSVALDDLLERRQAGSAASTIAGEMRAASAEDRNSCSQASNGRCWA